MRFAVSGDLFPHHVDEFTEAMAAFIKANYKIEELL